MKRSNDKSSSRKTADTVFGVLIVLLLISITFTSDHWVGKTALVSSALYMPQGSIKIIGDYIKRTSSTSDSSGNISPVNADIPEQYGKPDKYIENLTDVPEDIKELIEDAEKDFANQKEDGKIQETTFGKSNATDVFENVAVRNVTSTGKIDIKKSLSEEIDLTIDREKPAVLIFHTHTTEGYEMLDRGWYAADYSSRTKDVSKNIVRVGTAIEEALSDAGFIVIHDTTLHDIQYGGAYDHSRQTVQKYLDKYPNLVVALDIHRDAIQRDNGTKIKPVTVINGKKSAQVMIITGMEEGKITGYPNWEQNLRFALKLQKSCEDMFPSLMRPIFFCARKYTMDMTPCSLLIEMGSDANTLDEAAYAGRLLGTALGDLLKNYVTEKE
ncbi:MAG: stage II sporulation protein P [Clostridiales bacterium]|nr:stage II sporulation protein P [Clostridiales bacterium]